jgi:hypothetical protein
MNPGSSHPIPWETLVDYIAGELSGAESDAVEEHLFACATCSAEAARVASVTETLRSALPPAVSREKLEELRAGGRKLVENAFVPGDRKDVVFVPEADLLVHRLGGLELGDAERVSFQIRSESTGERIMEIDSAPFERKEGALLVACQRHYAALPHDTVFDISIHTAGGTVRTATYTLLHHYT